MQYFDLNIPYLESDKKTKRDDLRLTTMSKALELGFSGVAFNRTIKGPMSQSDACTITRFPLSSLLKFHPSLSHDAVFHRRLLGVVNPDKAPFRQYTRLTVVVENHAQSSALNSGNPVLKTYDLVAVKPLNQSSFDHACLSAQVDMISIDCGKKLPFRLKLSSIKTAIERGVYFEIMYSSFLEDAQVRRQMISTAKLLVEWTKGKNLIVSSAAASFHELRGPNDVSNLLHLLGLSNERAKAAISKNCRLLIANALRKKQFHKESIRVEMMPSGAPTNPKDPWIVDYLIWDPLSSGEGDLLLEDLAKSFAELGKGSHTVKSIDFTALIDSRPSHVKQGGDSGFGIEGISHSSGNVANFALNSMDLGGPKKTLNQQQKSTSDSTGGNTNETVKPTMCLSLTNSLEDGGLRISPGAILEEFNMSNTLEATPSPVRLDETGLDICVAIQAEDMVIDEYMKETISANDDSNVQCVSGSRDKFSVESENQEHNDVQAHTGKLESGAFNKTGTGVPLEVQFCVQSNSQYPSDSNLGNDLLQLKPNLVVEAASIECVDNIAVVDSMVVKSNSDDLACGDAQLLKKFRSEPEQIVVQQHKEILNEPERSDVHAPDVMMNVDTSIERDSINSLVLGISQCAELVTNEHEQNEEHHSVKTDAEEPQLSNTIMQVDSFYRGNDDDNNLIAKSMLDEEIKMETRKQVQELVSAEHQSVDERKSRDIPYVEVAKEHQYVEVAKEQELNEDRRSELETDSKESELSDSIMQVDSIYHRKVDDNCLITKYMSAEELTSETRKQAQEFVKAEHQSLGERKSGNLKLTRRPSGPVLMFPFKRLLQLQFKRKGRISMYKTRNKK